ncbi:MAG: TonB-dependent receptor [Edaphobacter sp.]|uniref:TonB-dependent receptor n=1 Tax=Edaphobacter sp. TaxID=1934404 RepID=UPI00238DDF71|nr:TonB-dependent receptor [Edaphobacter sp.]MDE1175686.1 TonB-dependent receptor [Edaphobacter sp.]
MLFTASVIAQTSCPNGIRIEGAVTDPSGAVIPGARIQTDDGHEVVTGSDGAFQLPCVSKASTEVRVQAAGFTAVRAMAAGSPGSVVRISLQMPVTAVQTDVQVSADEAVPLDISQGAGTTSLTSEDIRQLPDDPDDLLQQLQLLASTGGGAASSANVVVDGFQNGSAMPPKSSIASIRVNPDPISPEYERPDVQGGRIEITTKPGVASYHGALFLTDSDGSFNATNPFSVTATPAGKRRYGFELSGPIVSKKSGFSLALEKRDIDEFNVVNALQLTPDNTLGPDGNGIPLRQTVSAPQRLWIASGRADFQLGPKDMATVSYAANVNSRGNQGVGGFTTLDGGYSSRVAEYDLRFSNNYTISANTLHETRIGYTWKRTEQDPNATSPSLQVAGYFDSGGAVAQNLNTRERDLEIDDDVMIVRGKHEIKIGAQSLGVFVHNYNPNTFNGAYVFGGGTAPALDANDAANGGLTTINPLEQYRRAVLGLPGGNPTTYQLTTGDPVVPYTQWRLALFAEDTIKLRPRLTVTAGLRYSFQTAPSTFLNFGPRLGLAWSPDKKSSWTVHVRAGVFNVHVDNTPADQVYRLNGTKQQQATVYSPDYAHPFLPTAGSVQVSSRWQFPNTFEQIPVGELAAGIDRDLAHHWKPSVWFTWYEAWGDPRTVNINAPLVPASTGNPPDPIAALNAPRPGSPNLNIFEYQNSAHNRGSVLWAGIEQKSYKRWTLNIGAWNVNFRTDGATPQSTYSSRGEAARPDWQSSGALIENDLKLPYKLTLSTQTYWHYGRPYNLTTGTDANGDGTFNDRPSFASTATDSGTYATPFGLLTVNAVNGNVPRNFGTMPVIVHMYSNLSREFALGGKDKEHLRTLTLNARAVNLLNHTNVTAVGTVVSSSSLGQALSAEAARRVELGMRIVF